MKQEFLYLLSKDDLDNKTIFNHIYPNENINYYVSDDFSRDFYIKLCLYGFISTSTNIQNKLYLLPELQFEYAILDFSNLHISKKVKNLLNKNSFKFQINKDLKSILNKLQEYHKDSWLEEKYIKLILDLENYRDLNIDFELMYFGLYNENDILIAGEIGYRISKTYTSLTGFSSKNKAYNNWGKLQMVLLANYLEKNNFDFWNLGHPYMQYKFDLGATLYSRDEFLQRWLPSVNLSNNG